MRGGGAFNVGEPSVRNARYGLRGVRVGEASNPGPPQTRNRPRVIEVAEDIFASLEHDLTLIVSDDEPLVKGWFRPQCGPQTGSICAGRVADCWQCQRAQHQQMQDGSLSQPAPTGVCTRRLLSCEAVTVLQLGSAPDSGVTLLVDPDLPVSPRDSLLDALEHDLVWEGMTPSTVPASSRAVRASRPISPTQRSATAPAVSQDALECEVGHGVGPTVVDMSFDDTDQDEEVAMAGNRVAAPSDHISDRSKGGARDIRPSRRLVNRLMPYPRAITSGMPTQTAFRSVRR